MIKIFQSDGKQTQEISELQKGTWIKLTTPTKKEIRQVLDYLNLECDDITSAIFDVEEKNRLEITKSYTLILIDIPFSEMHHHREIYKTVPLIILLTDKNIVTICSKNTPILNYYSEGEHYFVISHKLNFAYQIMLRVSILYQQALRAINSQRMEFEERVKHINTEKDIISLHELESSLVYFATSLRDNSNVLNKLAKAPGLRKFSKDAELFDDIMIEHHQAMEMAQIYRDILDSTRELASDIINLRINRVMKRLTSITILLSIPMVLSGLYGMNVDMEWMPLAKTPHGFGLVCILIFAVTAIISIWLEKKHMM